MRAGLSNDDGRARGSLSSVYDKLNFDEIEPLLPSIYEAIVEPAPSGIMFADEIRLSGLRLFAKYQISEGVELLVDYSRNQNPWGSQRRIVEVMEMLKTYGAHGTRVIPQMEAIAEYFEKDEKDFPRHMSMGKAKLVRETIAAIEAATDKPDLIYLNL